MVLGSSFQDHTTRDTDNVIITSNLEAVRKQSVRVACDSFHPVAFDGTLTCLRAWMNLDDNIFVQQNEAVRVNDSGITIICDLWGLQSHYCWMNLSTHFFSYLFSSLLWAKAGEEATWSDLTSRMRGSSMGQKFGGYGSSILYQWFRLGTSSHTDVDSSPLEMFKPWKSKCVGWINDAEFIMANP